MGYDLAGRVALVTGSSRGIGRTIAMALAEAGAKVAVTARSEGALEELAAIIRHQGGEAVALAGDLTQVAQVRAIVDEVTRQFGRLDILVNNAGTSVVKPALEQGEEDWDMVFNLNLKAAFFCAQAAARVMLGQQKGKIINIASVGASIGESKMAPYAASKAALVSLTKTLAREWGRYNITVNSVAPGYVCTDLSAPALSQEEIYRRIIDTIPLRRLASASDIAAAVLFLASDAADYITGHTLYVDGGRLTGVAAVD